MSLRIKIIQYLIHINELIFFYPKLKRFYKNRISKKNVVIIDVGANKGQTIDLFINIYDSYEIYAFEPNKKLYYELKKKFFKYKNIHLQNAGVSEKRGELIFNENILDETSSFEDINLNSEYAFKKAKILGVKINELVKDSYLSEVITLHDFILEQQLKAIDILKIDVEGHELKVLKGLFKTRLKNRINYIQIESHNDDMYPNKMKEINKLLTLNNFKLLKSIKHGFGDFNELIYVLN